MIAGMRHRRSGICVASFHNSIYALSVELRRTTANFSIETNRLLTIISDKFRGGFNGSTRMNSCERYDSRTNTWTSVSDMFNPRSNFAVQVSVRSVHHFHQEK